MEELYHIEKINEHLDRLLLPGNVYSYIAQGKDKAILIDTGFGFGPYKSFVEEKLSGKPYELILTHGHLDHAGGAADFDRVYMNERDLEIARKHTDKKMRKQFLEGPGREVNEEDLSDEKTDGYLPLNDGDEFDLGDEKLIIVDLGGHTPGSIGVLFEKERLLLAGDACCSFTLLFGNGESLCISEYRNNLIRALQNYGDRFDDMIYSHPHNYGGKQVMSEMIELCNEILEGKDDHIEGPGLFDAVTYIAKKTDEKGRRLDGKIANLQYTSDCLK